MTASRLIIAVGVLLLIGMFWSLCQPSPSIYGHATVPIEEGELWRLNFH